MDGDDEIFPQIKKGEIKVQISDSKVVLIHYTLTSDKGETLDSSDGNPPLAYIQGKWNIIPGLENALVGKVVGDKLNVTIPPQEAYGEHNDDLIQTMSRTSFQGIEDIQPGMQLQMESSEGPQMITVSKVEGDEITVDGNHPLAGEELTFDVEVGEIREATGEELEHGHVHSPGEHHH